MGINGLELLNESVAESHDATDVPAALRRTTDDGPGFVGDLSRIESMLPASDLDEEDE